MFKKKRANKRSETTGKVVENPADFDILCGKDKTHAKSKGNQMFKERIEIMKVPYAAASTKQDKMKITKEIVAFMQLQFGSRFLKMEGDQWEEITEQAARDKVSHALRFAARNLKSSLTSSAATVPTGNYQNVMASRELEVPSEITSQQQQQQQQAPQQAPASSTTKKKNPLRRFTSKSDESTSDDESASDDEEGDIPIAQIFDHAFSNVAHHQGTFNHGPQHIPSNNHHDSTNPQQQPPPHSFAPGQAANGGYSDLRQEMMMEDMIESSRMSIRSMQLDDPTAVLSIRSAMSVEMGQITSAGVVSNNTANEAFDTLRSEDLNDILDDPITDEWAAVTKLAEC